MVIFPNCKINLGLRILRRRMDGYHDLETVFYPLPLKDVLEITQNDPPYTISTYGLPIPGNPAANLCAKAWELLKKDYPELPSVQIFLYKNIPMGAGLGGGSADGAAMLQLLDQFGGLRLGEEKLLEYAARLGSDCPFFILNKPCLGKGRGERLEPIGLDLSRFSFVLVHPGIPIGTAQAFAKTTPAIPDRPLKDIVRQPIATWAGELKNDFEPSVFQQYPELATLKEKLYTAGALYASMTGSGSSFFGIFEKGKIPSFNFEQHYKVNILI